MAKNNQSKGTTAFDKGEGITSTSNELEQQSTTSIESLLGVDTQEVQEAKVNEFAAVGQLQVLGLRELIMAETFGVMVKNISFMTEPKVFDDHKDLIKKHLTIALEVSKMVGQVYDENMGV
jgi:hypothetical protein